MSTLKKLKKLNKGRPKISPSQTAAWSARSERGCADVLTNALRWSAPCLGVALFAGCAAQEPEQFDPRAIQQPNRAAAKSVEARPLRPLPTTLESPYLPVRQGEQPQPKPATVPTYNEPVMKMPLREIVQRSVMHSYDIKVAGYAPAIESARTVEADANFDPTFFTNLSGEHRDRDSGIFNAGNADIYTIAAGVRQNLTGGGSISLSYQTSLTDLPPSASSTFANVSEPFYENELILQVTQPLLRNFGSEVNTARITISRNNERISLLDFRKQVEDTSLKIEQTYWQLVASVRDVDINERLLQDTMRTADIISKRVGQDVTRVQLSQANASVETRLATLIRARARVRDLSDQLKLLMNDPELPVTGNTVVLPADLPAEGAIVFDLQDQINTALDYRLELGQQQLRVDSANVAIGVAKNNLLPSLNVVGSVGLQGLDQQFVDATGEQVSSDHLNYTLGLQLEIPIGNRAARAVYKRAMLQYQQTIDTYKGQTDQIAFDVKTALREVDTTWNEIVQTRRARFANQDNLDALNQREANNEPLTPTFVQLKLDTQERLAQSSRDENTAVQSYNIAIATLEKAKGTLLRYNNILLEEGSPQLQQRVK